MNDKTDLVISIDSSTTACKAIAWAHDGTPVAEGRAGIEAFSPHPFWHEQRAGDWWHALVQAVQELLQQVSADRVAALCVTCQRETFVPVDEGGQPLRHAITWLDGRSRAQVEELNLRYGGDAIHDLTGKGPSTNQSLSKLMWLQTHEPGIAARTYKYLDVHAYLVYHLTGQWTTSLACADPMGIVDMRRGAWAEELLVDLGLDPARLVEIVPPGSVIGPLTPAAAEATGLSTRTLVVAGAGDGQCAGLGANITRPGVAYLNLGTAMVSGAYADRYVADRAFRTLCSPVAGAFVPEEVLTAGTFTVSWFMKTFGPDVSGLGLALSQEDVMEMAAASVPPGSLGLMVVPYWGGVMPPYWDPAATGITIGWIEAHRKEHFYRAILEGIGYEHRLVMDGISRATGQPIDEYILMGGGARSRLWCQIVADIHGKPISRARTTEATSLGAAILAATAAGWYADVRQAAAAMTATGQQFEPDASAHAVYERLFVEVYQRLFPAIRELVDRLTVLAHDREPEV